MASTPANDRLRQRRDEVGLSQEALGAEVGVDGMTVSRWERGESLPQRRFWSKLREITGLSITDLIDPSVLPDVPDGDPERATS